MKRKSYIAKRKHSLYTQEKIRKIANFSLKRQRQEKGGITSLKPWLKTVNLESHKEEIHFKNQDK